MTQTNLQLFPFTLDCNKVSQIQIQCFSNEKNINLKLYVTPTSNEHITKEKGRRTYNLTFPKKPNKSSLTKMKRDYSNVDGIEEHIENLKVNSNQNTIFAQCRGVNSNSQYYKMCDASLTPKSNQWTLRLQIFDEFIQIKLPIDCFDTANTKNQSHFVFRQIIDGYEFGDDEDHYFEPTIENRLVIKNKKSTTQTKPTQQSETISETPTFKEVTEDFNKKSEEASITLKESPHLNAKPLSEVDVLKATLKKLIKEHKDELMPLVPTNERGYPLDYLYQKALKSQMWKQTNDPIRVINDLRMEAKASTY